MNFKPKIPNQFFYKKLVFFCLLITISSLVFAASGGGNSNAKKIALLQKNKIATNGKFSLKSNYAYRGSQILSVNSTNTIRLHSIVTLQKGRATYILPLKTTVYKQRIKLSTGIPQMNK